MNYTNISFLDEWFKSKGLEEKAFNLIKNPPKENDFRLLNDIDKAVDIIKKAEKEKKKVRVWGDYDADGITGTSILLVGLRDSLDVDFQIPLREEGYGANIKMAEKAVEDAVDLIITVDNGIQCHEAINFVKSNGIKVIVTDHHEVGETLPNADAIVHPMLGNYPFPYISGATVALKLMLAYGISKEKEDICRQLAGLSVITDVMPVGNYSYEEMKNNENRYLLIDAIKRINKHPYHNLKVLMDISDLNREIDEKDIGFTIGPILNSTGRIESANTGVLLLTSEDEKEIELNASYACYLNDARKEMTKEAMNGLVDSENASNVLVVDAPAGLVGIIAGNVLNKYGKPTIVFHRKQEDGKNYLVGSSRSASISLQEAFQSIPQELFVNYGGHAMAAGVTIEERNLEEFKKYFDEFVLNNTNEQNDEVEAIAVSFDELYKKETLNALKALKPFGQGFQVPEFAVPMDIKTIDLYFKSGHASVSDEYGNKLWLYNSLGDAKEMAENSAMKKVADNTQKRMNGNPEKGILPMSEEEAISGHWERWDGNAEYYFLVETNYGTFGDNTGLQLTTITYEKR